MGSKPDVGLWVGSVIWDEGCVPRQTVELLGPTEPADQGDLLWHRTASAPATAPAAPEQVPKFVEAYAVGLGSVAGSTKAEWRQTGHDADSRAAAERTSPRRIGAASTCRDFFDVCCLRNKR